MAIFVNISRSGMKAVSTADIKAAAIAAWVISDSSIQEFGDFLVAVRKNEVVGVFSINAVTRDGDGKAQFEVSDTTDLNDLIGQISPVEWKQGQANPVKLVHTDTLTQEASAVELTAQGNRRVQLDGWSLIVYPDGRARIQSPDSADKLIVESAFPGPKGANVTVRLISL